MNLLNAHNQFLHQCENGTLKRRADATLRSYKESFHLLLKFFPLRNTEDLREDVLRRFFLRGEQERNWKASTIITHRKNLAPFIQWCVKNAYLDRYPLDKADIPLPRLIRNLPEYYSEEEMEKIMYHVNMAAKTPFERIRNTTIFGVLAMAGLRRGELMALTVTDIDWNGSSIRVRAETSKSRIARCVPMSSRLHELLERYVHERSKLNVETMWLWISCHKRDRFTEAGLKHLTKKITKKTGIRINSRKFRHTFGTLTYKGSNDILAVQQALGHKEITTTMIYTQIEQKQVKISIDKNPINAIF